MSASTSSSDVVADSPAADSEKPAKKKSQKIKCLVWDLDNTLWDGTLLEDKQVRLRPEAVEVIKTLDARGILQSIASRNDATQALAQLKAFGVEEYFLYPQINWNAKSGSVQQIAKDLNLGIDAFAFVDDQPFERDEVAHGNPQVLCLDAAELAGIPDLPQMQPRFITEDSAKRRQMYLDDQKRHLEEQGFAGTQEAFLANLGMKFDIASAGEMDLQRAEELTVRTHQLNSTGYTYSYEELRNFIQSPDHELLIAGLDDKYGSYGRIGLALVEKRESVWILKLLLMSCRVMSRGVGTVLLHFIMSRAQAAGASLQAEFVPTDRNRMMHVTYRFAGFRKVANRDGVDVLEANLSQLQPMPKYLDLRVEPPVVAPSFFW